MAVLERSELEASPLADLHTIANQVGLDGFRRLRKADLIDAILGETISSSDSSSQTVAIDDEDRSDSAPSRRAGVVRPGPGAQATTPTPRHPVSQTPTRRDAGGERNKAPGQRSWRQRYVR